MFTLIVTRAQRRHVGKLLREFPNIDRGLLSRKYPNVDVKRLEYKDSVRGHYVPKIDWAHIELVEFTLR